jgi:hypothetical protein
VPSECRCTGSGSSWCPPEWCSCRCGIPTRRSTLMTIPSDQRLCRNRPARMTHASLRSGIAPRLGMRMVGHQVTRVSRHVGAVRVANRGRHPGHSAIDQQVGSRQLTTVGCTQPRHARSVLAAERQVEKQLTKNRCSASRHVRPEPTNDEPSRLHQLVHQRLRTTMNVLGRESEDWAQPWTPAGSGGCCL